MHSNKTKEKFFKLRADGWSLARISDQIGVSKTTLVEWNHQFRDRLRSLQAVRLEALHERILADQESDLARLLSRQRALEKELDKRPLSEVPIEKVFHMVESLRRQVSQAREQFFALAHEGVRIPPLESLFAQLKQSLVAQILAGSGQGTDQFTSPNPDPSTASENAQFLGKPDHDQG